ncbi:hypothetical protein HED60_22070 [Planctomycetales bacterium ZRK34]|nr:hypothetical protein HED60_22070 [Planctomycetales bacterium ZRK34]
MNDVVEQPLEYHTRRSPHWAAGWVIALLAVGLSVQWSPAFRDIETDQGVFMYVGWQMTQGEMPYRDVWDHKPPGIYLLNALGMAATGDGWGVWALETAIFAAAMGVMFVVMGRAMGLSAAVVGVGALMLAMRSNWFLAGGNTTESFATPLIGLLLAGVIGRWRCGGMWLGLGLAAGLVVMLKQTVIAAPMAVGVVLIVWALRRDEPMGWKPVVGYAAGLLGFVGTTIGAMAAAGLLDEFYNQNFVYNSIYVKYQAEGLSSMRSLWQLVGAWEKTGTLTATVFTGVICLVRLAPRKTIGWALPQQATAGVVLAVLLVQSAAVVAAGQVRMQYVLPLLPLVAVGMWLWVSTLTSVLEHVGRPEKLSELRRVGWAAMAGAAVCVLPVVSSGLLTIVGATGIVRQQNDQQVIDYLAEAPAGPLLMWGNAAAYNVLSGRPAPTRYAYCYPLCPPSYDHATRFDEFMADLAASPNTIIIDTQATSWPPNALAASDTGPAPESSRRITPLRQIPDESMQRLRRYIAQRYRRDRVLDNGWVVYQPRAIESPPKTDTP